MQTQALGWLPVQVIPDDGRIQAIGMCCMHTQLVCSSRHGYQADTGWRPVYTSFLTMAKHLIRRNGHFSLLVVHPLQRAVLQVWCQWQSDDA